MTPSSTASTGELQALVDDLLVRDAGVHAEATAALAEVGDERVFSHLLEVVVIDSIASNWERFGFPEVLRERDPPRYLDLPEVHWPGACDALAAIAEPDYDSPHAWVEWESWYSQQEIDPLPGFDDWKLQLYRSYLPPVGSLLDAEPRNLDLQDVRWGNCDRSFLAALNGPTFVPGAAVDAEVAGDDGESAAEDAGDHERYLRADHHVFGFELDGVAYAVPRFVLFPHELLNATLQGQPVSLTYCTLCNAPILYDRRVDGDVLTFGSTGMLLSGNKVMYDEETETLWDQHVGTPMAGEYLAESPDLTLEGLPVTQTTWGEWREAHSDTRALAIETGYGYDYPHYDGNVSFFEHYWGDESVVQPGVRQADDRLPEKESVYGLVGDDGDEVWVVPVDDVAESGLVTGTVDGKEVVAVRDATGDVPVYEAPSAPLERRGDVLVDGDGTAWDVERSELRGPDGETLDRIPGRHGLWFAFRTHYEIASVLGV